MIVQESDDDEQHGHANTADASAGAGNAFMTAQRGVDGASRDAKGNLKFNKNTKRAREMEREDEAMDLDELIGDKKEKKKKREVVRLGSEFKAKVGRRCFTCFVIHFSPCGSPTDDRVGVEHEAVYCMWQCKC
jgi:ribosomal RNA-processing protein 12